jgi:hypothetical protein
MNRHNKLECFITGKPFQPGVMQHANLLGPFVSYEENEVWMRTQAQEPTLERSFIQWEVPRSIRNVRLSR